jgi:hypothetical protein
MPYHSNKLKDNKAGGKKQVFFRIYYDFSNELPQGKPCGIRFFYEKSVDREEIYIQVLV